MIQDVNNHKIAYSLLAISAGIFLWLIYSNSHREQMLLYTTIGFGGFYFVWGVAHHLIERNLTGRIMLEYALVTALGIGIMSTLLL